ncbi:RNA-binding transcriptional accessory protein [Nakamurella antarctica]|uniref:RNA-binding transcriptional accessory protein n=1 Tax=Nakamurella antarctica TaxID=1902245 RepID=A0A3G8ZYT3_9ACTN|nr:RNA-binding transcriptional accessory protein [Nakamurella antarctica]
MQNVIVGKIAEELGVAPWQVQAAVELLDGGATVPFVARYRKEVTGTLDDTALRTLEDRLHYLRELEDRRGAIVESIRGQGKLDDAVALRIATADTKARLEDIYLPYKPKRRTKAQIAREAGLQPLADQLLGSPEQDPQQTARSFVDVEKGIDDVALALGGARAILVEQFGEDADLVGELREKMWRQGRMVSAVRSGKETDGAKFADYFDFAEALQKVPSHRALAMLRGENEDILSLTLSPEAADRDPLDTSPNEYERRIAARFKISDQGRPGDAWLRETVRWAWRTKFLVSLGVDLRMRLRQAAEASAATVFAENLRDLLLAAPAGGRTTLGLDPGLRTGTKVAVVDGTGKVVAIDTIYPHQPHNKWEQSKATLQKLITTHHIELIAIGNGTASRETDKLAAELVAANRQLSKIVVSEAGASVYSASAYASAELPDLDVSIRGAVSIARRLQDPLAELVKIDPKSIGVGQYQHDISEGILARSLNNVVEDCVNAVGVDVNTASVPLLTRVSGITTTLAENIVSHRDSNGPFASRKALKDVPRLGAKAYEQCAGFLRISGGQDVLDRSSVHPEAYPVVRKILRATGQQLETLIGNVALLHTLRPEQFVDDTFGVPTITDILAELEKPGRDPRPEFTTATFAEGVEKISDLRPGMVLEGVVTNVAAFGAFIDIGVHQDGLAHVSALSEKFVSDPREVVKSGQVVRVKVMEIDPERKRIALTLRLTDEPGAGKGAGREGRGGAGRNAGARGGAKPEVRAGQIPRGTAPAAPPAPGGALADALKRAGFGK